MSKSTTKPTTKVTTKVYKCKVCGHKKELTTNHYGECYSLGDYNQCPKCPRFRPLPKNWSKDYDPMIINPTVWVCDTTKKNQKEQS